MKILLKISLLILLFSGTNCSREDEDTIITETDEYGVIISKDYKWKYSLHESGSPYRNGLFEPQIVYNKNIVIPTTGNEGKQQMQMLNTKTLSAIWKWDEVLPESSGHLVFFNHYIYNNFLTWQQGKTSYCVELNSGNTQWKIYREQYFSGRITPYINNYFFIVGNINRDDGYDESANFIGNIETGSLELFIRTNLSCEYAAPTSGNDSYGGVSYVNIIQNSDLLLVTYSEPLPEWKVKMMFGLYNPDSEQWIYERKELVEPHWNAGVQHTPIIYNNNVYAAAGNSIVCHDIMTGEQLWRRDFPQDFLFSGFIIEEGKIIAMCEDTILYCIDPETGSTIWEGEGAGTSSKMSYLNGVVYFVGGSTRKLHAVDISTGTTVWRIDARNISDDYGKFMTNAVYVIPGENGEKGKVIALTSMYAICYEAYK